MTDPAKEPVRFEVALERGFVWSLFVTAMESGFSPWVRGARLKGLDPTEATRYSISRMEKPRLVWWGHDCFQGFVSQRVELTVLDEDDDEKAVELDCKDFAKALGTMAKEAPHSLALFLSDDQDGPSADAWLQCAVFGRLVYG